MSQAYIWGIAAGVFVGAVFLFVLLWAAKSDGSLKGRYDERQELFRGRGYKRGFFVFMAYCAVYGLLKDTLGFKILSDSAAMFAGICLSVSVYACYCIRHDAYLALNERPVRIMVSFFLIALVNLGIGVYHLTQGDLIENGVLNFSAMNPICGLMMGILAFAMLLKYRDERRHLEEE